MISDVLYEAEAQIGECLASCPSAYGLPGEPLRDAIDNLRAHMEAIRCLPGLDQWPDESKAVNDLAAIAKRWGPLEGGQSFPRATLDDLLATHRPPVTNGRTDR